MKLLFTGDLHLRNTAPHMRIDDYGETQRGKVQWILECAADMGVAAVLQPGDCLDGPRPSNKLLSDYITLFKRYGIPILVVYGQHDLRYRSRENSALAVFSSAGAVTVVPTTGIALADDVVVYGASWGDPLPSADMVEEVRVAILLVHTMVVKSERELLWPGQEDYNTADAMIQRYKGVFKAIVTGDNHRRFFVMDKDAGTVLVNCGSLMRAAIDQQQHKPAIVIYDCDSESVEQIIDVPVAPIEEVMDVDRAVEEKRRNEELELFVQGLASYDGALDQELSFERRLREALASNKVSQGVRDMVNELLQKCVR